MYRFLEDIEEEAFNNFILTYPDASIEQTTSWARLKTEWQHSLCGIYRDDVLVGTALVLTRQILPFMKYAYCPRGPLMDFGDPKAVNAFKDGIMSFCKKKGIYCVMIDPPIIIGKIPPEIDEKDYFDPFEIDFAKFDNLISAGFIHCGFSKELNSTLQPRFNAVVPLKKGDMSKMTFDELKKNFKTKIRKYFANFQSLRGLYFEKAQPTDENIAVLKSVISKTENRKHILLRGEKYFKLMAESFGESFFLGFEKCDVSKYIRSLKNHDGDAEKISNAENVKSVRGNIIPLSALLTIYPPNREGIKKAEFLYSGSDLTVFPSFSATLCGLGEVCKQCIENDVDFLNLGGISGTLDGGLYDFKKQFSPIILEYAGEFELVIKKHRYAFMKKCLPAMQKTYRRAAQFVKGIGKPRTKA